MMNKTALESIQVADVERTSTTDGVVAEPKVAHDYNLAQHKTPWQSAVKQNPKAVLWCCYALFTCIMWGFDGLASGIVLAISAFREDYGYLYEGAYVVGANWQLGFTGASLVGLLIGGAVTGVLVKHFGRQLCMALAYLLTIGGVFMQYYGNGRLPLFLVSKIVTGIPLGVFVTVAPTYCSEIAPFALRGATTAAVNFSIVLGQLIAYGVLRQTQSIVGSNSYRILFAVQWGFAAVALLILPFFPESPYQLLVQGREDKARRNIVRLHGQSYDVEGLVASIKANIAISIETEKVGFMECFRGKNRKRTLIAMSAFAIQSCSGNNWVIGYMAYFFVLAGLEYAKSTDLTVGLTGVMLVGNVFGWYLIEKAGRRSTMVYGSAVLSVTLIVIGIMGSINSSGAVWAQAGLMAVWGFTYQATIGSAAWPFITEVPTSALRGHTQSLATTTTGLAGAIWSFALPYMFNPDEANLGGKIGYIFGGILTVFTVAIFFAYPETKGRTFAEIDTLFDMGVPMRKFGSTRLAAVAVDKMDNVDATSTVHVE